MDDYEMTLMPADSNDSALARRDASAEIDLFWRVVDMIAPEDSTQAAMVAPSSARVYRDTFARWFDWTLEQGHSPALVTYAAAAAYLTERGIAQKSRYRELTALRKLAEVLTIVDMENPTRRAAMESLKLLKIKHLGEQDEDRERTKITLSQRQIRQIIDAYTPGDQPNPYRQPKKYAAWLFRARDQAVLAMLAATGMRRSELVALRWDDFDEDLRTVRIRHGKGDKARTAVIPNKTARRILRDWYDILHETLRVSEVRTLKRKQKFRGPDHFDYVFPRMGRSGTPHMTGKQTHMSDETIFRIVQTAGREVLGIDFLAPHDLRRSAGTAVARQDGAKSAQQFLGHASPMTTLAHYVAAVDAEDLADSIDFDW